MTYPTPKFHKNQAVRFAKRCQSSEYMTIDAVDTCMFGVLYFVKGQWWTECCLTEYKG